jgi:ABC-type antimicrobial peptide transport system permease subunit
MNDLVEGSLVAESSMAQIASMFGVLALSLACIGLYGTLSYAVAQRTNEIGIRMALGARVHDVIAMLALQTGWTVGIGIAAGLLGTFGLMRMISSFLFGLTSNDPATVFVAALVLIAASALAAYVPARRASRVDPMVALRHE